jgi:hypothetical protein
VDILVNGGLIQTVKLSLLDSETYTYKQTAHRITIFLYFNVTIFLYFNGMKNMAGLFCY